MKKISLEQIEQTLRDRKIEPAKIVQIVKDLEDSIKEEAADREPTKKSKKQFVVVEFENTGTGGVCQIEEGGNPADVPDRIKAVGDAFNNSKKGRKYPVTSTAQIFSSVPRKFWKTDDGKTTLAKTKDPVYILPADGKIK